MLKIEALIVITQIDASPRFVVQCLATGAEMPPLFVVQMAPVCVTITEARMARLKASVRTMPTPTLYRGRLTDEERQAIFMGMTLSQRFFMGLEASELAQWMRVASKEIRKDAKIRKRTETAA
jgi:hypothetical protein